ncbi:MAG: squalene--hopene cyclase [Dehalococcoidia bacterium]|jgi:squalene-hopene/tetraprenyl-beta-curcumene cyclase
MKRATMQPAIEGNGVQADDLDRAIASSQAYLLALQHASGYWAGELEADASVTAGYLPLMHWLGRDVAPERKRKALNYVLGEQNADGSWPMFRGGAGDLSVTVQVYFSLKLSGLSADEELMRKARDFVLANGGVMKANIITKAWLSLFGEFDWRGVPVIPPEIIFFPRWAPFNIYELSSWARATIMALSILSATRPIHAVPPAARIEELYIEPPAQRNYRQWRAPRRLSWAGFFIALDRLFALYERSPVKPGRGLALRRVERWLRDHQDTDGSWGGIMLPWIYAIFALKSLGRRDDDPAIAGGIAGLERFVVEDADSMRLQPSVSVVWDTAWAILALRRSGLPASHPALVKAAEWLLGKETRLPGDWAVKGLKDGVSDAGCWSFEFENRWYPDIDDTALVARALNMVQLSEEAEPAKKAAIERAKRWIVGMQSDDGGWAAFDRNNNRSYLEHVPFADFITPLDPTSPDITNHGLDLLSDLGDRGPAASAGVDYLKRRQEADGSWFGRWGVNHIYGTGLVLPSLVAADDSGAHAHIRRAAGWLTRFQHDDGGWGETCATYHDPSLKGKGPSTASQTAWALLGLAAAGECDAPCVRAGVDYLLRNQVVDGGWPERDFTGTGFPRAFYLRYGLYSTYFPLLALSMVRSSWKEARNAGD